MTAITMYGAFFLVGGVRTATQPRPVIVSFVNTSHSVFSGGGTALVIHERADDLRTSPSGHAGRRIACAEVIPPAAEPSR